MLKSTWMRASVMGLVFLVSGTIRAADEDVKSEAIGSLAASFLVQTYLNVGLLADASTKKDADKEQLESTLTTVEKLLSTTEGSLDALVKSNDVSAEDKSALKKIKSCYALLDEEITELKTFFKEGGEKNAKSFDAARVAAWKKISDTLGIK